MDQETLEHVILHYLNDRPRPQDQIRDIERWIVQRAGGGEDIDISLALFALESRRYLERFTSGQGEVYVRLTDEGQAVARATPRPGI